MYLYRENGLCLCTYGGKEMIKEILLLYTNWRFWSFIIIACLPLEFGIISCGYFWLKGIVNETVRRYTEEK